MSLFPAATATNVPIKKEEESTNDWLRNSSYHSDRSSELVKLQGKVVKHDSSDSSESETVRKKYTKIKDHKKAKKRKQQSTILEEVEDIKREKISDGHLVLDGKTCVIVDHLEGDVPKFLSDKNKDMDNVHFGRLYKVLKPKYYQDLVYCVGTPAWQYLQVNKGSKKKRRRRKQNTDNDNRYFNSELEKNVTSFNLIKQKDSSLSFDENYIKIMASEEITEEIYENTDFDNEAFTKKTTEELNRKSRENPQDIETWMKLLSWQDTLLKDSMVLGRSRILTEKKIEILNHAIKANPRDAKLQLIKIRLNSELISDTSILDKEWQNLLFRFPDNIEVWQGYILYINCNNFTAFSLKRTRRAFAHCIEILMSIKCGKYKQEISADISIEERLVQVFTEYVQFLFATGHVERCVALYQCILELNFRGTSTTTDWSDVLEYMHQYFTSKELRLGEKGSKGFQAWAAKHEAGGWIVQSDDPIEDTEEEDVDVDPDESLTQNWLKMEFFRSERDWLPWRPSLDEDDACDDEDRKVAFSEIKDLMFTLDKKFYKIRLLRNFLHMLGAPIQCLTTMHVPFASQHIFYFTHHQQVIKPIDKLFNVKPLLLGSQKNYNLGFLNTSKHKFVHEMFSQLLHCCSDEAMKSMLCLEFMNYYENRMIGLFLNGKTKGLKKCGKDAKKVAKQLLSMNPDLLQVWCSFGIIEWLSGKKMEACKIFQTTLLMSTKSLQTLDREARTKLCSEIHYLCRTFSQLHFMTCESCTQSLHEKPSICHLKSTIQHLLSALANDYKFTECIDKLNNATSGSALRPTTVMKTISGFARLTEELESLYEQYEYEKMDDMIESKYLSSYFDVICCHYIFTVHSHSSNSDEIFENSMSFLRKKIRIHSTQAKLDLEHLHFMRLFSLRSTVKSRSHARFRKAIYEAANEFPNNPYFAQLLGDVDMSSYLCGNVRRHFTRTCNEHAGSVLPWLCAINFELKRRRKILENNALSDITTTNDGTLLDARIRNLFEHSLAVGTNMGSLVLWRAYLAAEEEMDRSKVPGLYTRAVNSCSWSRDLHIDILQSHPDRLVEVVGNMSKKGLRLRTPVEEIQLLMTI